MSAEETQHAIQMFREQYAENERLRVALRAQLEPCDACHGRSDCDERIAIARAALGDREPGPRAACPECGVGGDVGGTEPNPIPF